MRNRSVNQGRRKLWEERAEYFRLMDLGYSNKAACQAVGINLRTGREWRNGRQSPNRTVAPAQHVRAPQQESGRYLRLQERLHIADRLRDKASIRTIASELGRFPSTISREVRRNRSYYSKAKIYRYGPHVAHDRAVARRARPKPGKIAQSPRLRDYIQRRLKQRWSPEQIAHQMRRDFPEDAEMRVTHETIYQALYVQGRGELRRELTRSLRSGRARRRPHRQAHSRQPRYTHPMVMISERPAEVSDRAVPGHWEGDLIVGGRGEKYSAIGTLVERSTRFVMLMHLPDGQHQADRFHQALTDSLGSLPPLLKRSLTWDQGNELANHHRFTLATDIPVYFCDPASPWQRGSNENTNGLLRQYFPKGTDLSVHSAEDLDAVTAELNSRPRKTLGWDTPAERLAQLLTSSSG
ncbi:IS30 family transposase [Nocardiopsis sp. FR6]|uniref:IS30 family transposase n=1 Tax=Nocardiopsis sp. FR6 TaxID=2605986 RepID=UPI001F26ED59|nr:IS30 family transposase [Nocardiopsis sp. FR6]